MDSRILMERAGNSVFQAIREMLPDGGRIAVVCGKGNNGGDGFVVARAAREAGFGVECLVTADEGELSTAATDMMRSAKARGVAPIFSSDSRYTRKLDALGHFDLIVDAILGTGAKCQVRESVLDAIRAINRSGVPVIAVDVPSGIDCDTGDELGESVWALRTITFGLPKPFLFQGRGIDHAGYWTVADIGFPSVLLEEPSDAVLIDGEWVANLLPERMRVSHKGDNGNVLIVAGSDKMRGAAVLSTLAALRSGAGLVTVASVPSVCDAISARIPEALLLPLPEEDGAIAPQAADVILEATRTKAAVFGPGLGCSHATKRFLDRVWADWSLPAVIDADALNAVACGIRLPNAPCILTPHPGEMSRLMQSSIAELQSDRFRTAEQAAERMGQTVLLKGPYSIVGSPGQPMLVNPTGNPGMATGGMGDVLSGILGTLLAQELPPYYAGGCGMYWHGEAADMCADSIGSIGYTASEVADRIPGARQRIVGA